MSPRTLIVVVLALVCGGAALVGVKAMSRPQDAPSVATKPVVYAVADIQRGETIREPALEIKQVAADQIPVGALTTLVDASGRAAHIPMLKGEMVVEAKLSPKGAGSGMAALIKPGMRAFTIQTPSLSSSLAGFLLPGNKVDVLLSRNSNGDPNDDSGGATTSMLLQNVEILAVHTTVDAPVANKIDPNDARSVTLLVTPDDATKLDLGQNTGTLHLSLRNIKDDLDTVSKPITLSELVGRKPKPKPVEAPIVVQAPAPAPAPAPEPAKPAPPLEPPSHIVLTVRTLRGTQSGMHQVTVAPPRSMFQEARSAENTLASRPR